MSNSKVVEEVEEVKTLLELFTSNEVDLSKPTKVREFITNNLVEFKFLSPDKLLDALIIDAAYRMLSKDLAKTKVGSSEYATEVATIINKYWSNGYKDAKSYNDAHKVIKSKSGAKVKTFDQVTILEELAQILPTGNGEKAKRGQNLLVKYRDFEPSRFSELCEVSLNSSKGLLYTAIVNVSRKELEELEEEAEAKRAELEADLI